MKQYIANVEAIGGGDFPEDVVGGLNKVLGLNWDINSKKQVFHVCDAPEHGKQFYDDSDDDYPAGSPEGLKIEPLMQQFCSRDIQFTCIKLNNHTNKMYACMKENHPKL